MSLLSIDFQKAFYRAAQQVVGSLYYNFLRGETGGAENIPITGPFLLACNHLSFMDPPIIGCSLPRPIYYFARDSLFKPGFVEKLLTTLYAIPVKRDSDGDVGAIKRVLKILQSGEGLLLFIEGTRSQDGNLQGAKPGVGMFACKTGVPVIPARLFDSHKLLDRTNEGLNLQTQPSMAIGPALLPRDYDPGKSDSNRYQTAADRILAAIAALKPPKDPGI